MRYLITHPDHRPFYCSQFYSFSHLLKGSTVFDLELKKHNFDGKGWEDTLIDSL